MTAHSRFNWFELRTTDVAAASAFYADVVGFAVSGTRLLVGDVVVGEVTPLPARAIANGAPSHWLGHIGVDNIGHSMKQLIELGGAPLGAEVRTDDMHVAVMRDPFGAVLALSTKHATMSPVAWHQLNTQDRARAWSVYATLFGWSVRKTHELQLAGGPYQEFAWTDHGDPVGGIVASAALPGVHAAWIFYFRVDDLDAAIRRVDGARGETFDGPHTLPSGARVAICHDSSGAQFGLWGQDLPI